MCVLADFDRRQVRSRPTLNFAILTFPRSTSVRRASHQTPYPPPHRTNRHNGLVGTVRREQGMAMEKKRSQYMDRS